MVKTAYSGRALTVELALLLFAAPALYFSNWFPPWATWLSLALLAGSWFWRRMQLGRWLVRTPADLPILLLFAVMLPVAIWIAPESLRSQYSLPRALIMVWNFSLFSTIVAHASLHPIALNRSIWTFIAATTMIGLLAPLGINWQNKFPPLAPIFNRIPTVLHSVFSGAENGFSPNQVAGTLLYVLPLLYALVLFAPAGHRLRRPEWWLGVLISLYMTSVLILTQSRAGLLGLGFGALVVILLPLRWGRWGLITTIFLLLLAVPVWLAPVLNSLASMDRSNSRFSAAVLNTITLSERQEVWSRAITGIQDFSITGMGLGTFRAVMPVLYPVSSMAPGFDIAHAHNFFFQTALDFGMPGLLALLAIYLVIAVQLAHLWHASLPAVGALPLHASWRTLTIGAVGCLAAQTVYSQLDAVTLGSKPSFLLWLLFAVTLAAANCTIAPSEGVTPTKSLEESGFLL